MERCGWPAIPYDGQLLVTHQDALLIGGKVQAPAGFADHVRFLYPDFCERCASQDVHRDVLGPGHHARRRAASPLFDREKCVHCGACLWNCRRRWRTIRSAATSPSAQAPAGCTRRRIEWGRPVACAGLPAPAWA